MNTWKAILAALVIFAAGTITGALISKKGQTAANLESRQPGSNMAVPGLRQRLDFLRRLDKPLKLNDQQRDLIEQILAHSQERMKVLWQEVSPRMQLELEQTRDSVRHELTAEQQVKFDEILRMRNQRRPEGSNHRDLKRERPHDKESDAFPKVLPEAEVNAIKPTNSNQK